MGNLWLKIKIWTKTLIVVAMTAYALLFIYNNSAREPVKFWYWFNREPETSPLLLVLFSFLAGVIGTLLVRATFTTIRQIRELRERNRITRLERDNADMRAKAAMLQTRTSTSGISDPGSSAGKEPMTNVTNVSNEP